MKFNIGSIVKNCSNETLIILATKEYALTSNNLNTINGDLLIKGIDKIAKLEIHVRLGFDYEVGKIKSFEAGYCVLDDDFAFQAVFEEDLSQ